MLFLGIARAYASLERARRRAVAPRSTADDAVRAALPFAAALLLVFILIAQHLSVWSGQPPAIETAVAEQFGDGSGAPDVFFSTSGWAELITCETIDASVDDAPLHVCETVHCEVTQESFPGCTSAIVPACAAMVDDELVLVSRAWSAGPESLRWEMAHAAGGRCAT